MVKELLGAAGEKEGALCSQQTVRLQKRRGQKGVTAGRVAGVTERFQMSWVLKKDGFARLRAEGDSKTEDGVGRGVVI